MLIREQSKSNQYSTPSTHQLHPALKLNKPLRQASLCTDFTI